MSDDTISRQAAIEAITDEHIVTNMDSVYDSELHRCKRATHRILASLPSAERRGKWKTLKGYPNILLCSECDTPYEKKEFAITPNYCYNCGAKMVNEDE